MGKYFDKNEDIDVHMDYSYLKDVLFIKYKLAKFGNFKGDLTLLKNLWEMFSEDCYCASFLIPDDESIGHFANWLDNYEEDI